MKSLNSHADEKNKMIIFKWHFGSKKGDDDQAVNPLFCISAVLAQITSSLCRLDRVLNQNPAYLSWLHSFLAVSLVLWQRLIYLPFLSGGAVMMIDISTISVCGAVTMIDISAVFVCQCCDDDWYSCYFCLVAQDVLTPLEADYGVPPPVTVTMPTPDDEPPPPPPICQNGAGKEPNG